MNRSRFDKASPIRRAFAFLAIAFVACTEPTTGPLPDGATHITAPSSYKKLWASVESCSGLSRSIDSIDWYVVPNARLFTFGGRQYAVLYRTPARIVIAGGYTDSSRYIAHVALHALLRDQGDTHPAEYFVSKCGKLVAPADSP